MIYRALNSIIDYLLFTLGFIIAVQLPEFIQQYKQYIAGKVTESEWHLNNYQKIADNSFSGEIDILISEYLKSEQLAIQQTGYFVTELKQRYETLTQLLTNLDSNNYFSQVLEFFKQVNIEDAQTVMSYYQLAVPLTVEAISSGVVLALIAVWIKIFILFLLGRSRTVKTNKQTI